GGVGDPASRGITPTGLPDRRSAIGVGDAGAAETGERDGKVDRVGSGIAGSRVCGWDGRLGNRTGPVTARTAMAKWTTRPTACAAILFVAGCGFLRRPDPPIDRSRDARILSEVRGRLESEPALDADRVRVEVEGAIVRLYG